MPLALHEQGFDDVVLEKLGISAQQPDMTQWQSMVDKIMNLKKSVRIALVGKYVALHDAYMSVYEALRHGGIANDCDIEIKWINSEDLEAENADLDEYFSDCDGILVPGGFGDRGIEGKIIAVRYAREHSLPFFGLCLGMQCAVIEYARNVCGLIDAHSTEFAPESVYPVIDLMEDQVAIENMGGTMRLGAYPCRVTPGTLTHRAYMDEIIYERHRHRYEFNNAFRDLLTANGLVIGGESPSGRLVEIVEVKDHPWYVATQFHPEFKSRPTKPHPLFREFVAASAKFK